MEPHKEYFKAYYSGINPIDFINEYDILQKPCYFTVCR